MAQKARVLFFDAGNTLVFPRVEKLARELCALGYTASVEEFYEAERMGKHRLDDWLWPLLRSGDVPRKADYFYWEEYLRALVRIVRVPEEKQSEIGLRMAEGFKEISTWSDVLPETPGVLECLKQRGYFLGVISNSLGLIEEQLRRAGLAAYFGFILDSHYVGVEKPHPEIFQLALSRAGCKPSEALYVGDLYSTDIGGAQNAGLQGVLIDRVGAYPHAKSLRIASLSELDSILRSLEDGRPLTSNLWMSKSNRTDG